jgi:deoxyhypusine monooxygenase
MKKPEICNFGSVDPAPPSSYNSIKKLNEILIDENAKMFDRMRAIFSLRNYNSYESICALSQGFNSKSALLKHEIAYVMGQMQNEDSIPHLIKRLEDENEHVMVRHEAAEAIGAIGSQSSKKVLEKYLNHKLPEISESCEVALGLLSYYNNETFE